MDFSSSACIPRGHVDIEKAIAAVLRMKRQTKQPLFIPGREIGDNQERVRTKHAGVEIKDANPSCPLLDNEQPARVTRRRADVDRAADGASDQFSLQSGLD